MHFYTDFYWIRIDMLKVGTDKCFGSQWHHLPSHTIFFVMITMNEIIINRRQATILKNFSMQHLCKGLQYYLFWVTHARYWLTQREKNQIILFPFIRLYAKQREREPSCNSQYIALLFHVSRNFKKNRWLTKTIIHTHRLTFTTYLLNYKGIIVFHTRVSKIDRFTYWIPGSMTWEAKRMRFILTKQKKLNCYLSLF